MPRFVGYSRSFRNSLDQLCELFKLIKNNRPNKNILWSILRRFPFSSIRYIFKTIYLIGLMALDFNLTIYKSNFPLSTNPNFKTLNEFSWSLSYVTSLSSIFESNIYHYLVRFYCQKSSKILETVKRKSMNYTKCSGKNQSSNEQRTTK